MKDIEGTLADLKARLADLLGESLLRLDLFGSRARGDESRDSDVDIAIVVRGLQKPLRDRILTVVAEVELQHLQPLSAIVFSEDEFSALRDRERRIALDIVTEGKPL